MLPNFIIIGAEKAATTFLHVCLIEHPEVLMPSAEIPFFEDPDYGQSDIKAFEELFEKGRHKKAIGIKRPNYLHKPECPERIHRHIPDAKLVISLRDPIDRAISSYYHNALFGFAPIKHVNTGLEEIINGKYAEKYPRSREIYEFGFYYEDLSRYLRYFDRKQMLIMLYDNIRRDSLGSLKKIFHFLDIDEEYVPKSINSRPVSSVYSIPKVATAYFAKLDLLHL